MNASVSLITGNRKSDNRAYALLKVVDADREFERYPLDIRPDHAATLAAFLTVWGDSGITILGDFGDKGVEYQSDTTFSYVDHVNKRGQTVRLVKLAGDTPMSLGKLNAQKLASAIRNKGLNEFLTMCEHVMRAKHVVEAVTPTPKGKGNGKKARKVKTAANVALNSPAAAKMGLYVPEARVEVKVESPADRKARLTAEYKLKHATVVMHHQMLSTGEYKVEDYNAEVDALHALAAQING